MGSSARGRLIDTDQVGQRAMEDETVRNRIRAEIARNDVVLFMKGTPQISAMRLLGGGNRDPVAPRCQLHRRQRARRRRDSSGRQEVFQLADHSTALCEAGIRRRLRHRARDVSERRTSEALARQGRDGREIGARSMYRGSMAQMADIKDGLRINEESLQPRPWPAFPLPVPKTESIARDRAPVPLGWPRGLSERMSGGALPW